MYSIDQNLSKVQNKKVMDQYKRILIMKIHGQIVWC